MLRRDDDEIWYWYQKLEDAKQSPLRPKAYCDEHGLDYTKFHNMYYRIVYKRYSDPKLYAELEDKARIYMRSGKQAAKFARDNDIHIRHLSEMVTHLRYRDIIEKIKSNPEPRQMQFIQVPTVQPSSPAPVEAELMKKQNHVELIISAGVKVVVAPEVGADKLIRIIELLKDL